ncbi:MAG TPA: GMC family oxidoreductase [Planctomycetaceae bacterium]|nr:GMC family oxidoreductase [Planctomycetaceae bacterium]
MSNLNQSHSEVRRGYHSGLSGEAFLVDSPSVAKISPDAASRTVIFETFKYPSSRFKIVLRTNRDKWAVDHWGSFDEATQQWSFPLSKDQYSGELEINFVLFDGEVKNSGQFWNATGNKKFLHGSEVRYFSDPEIYFAFKIEFKTSLWHPNHLITLRNGIDGWHRDLFGEFIGDTWTFYLDIYNYRDSFDAKFVLHRTTFMNESNVHVHRGTFLYQFIDDDVSFASSPTAYRHGYDKFVSVESRIEQLSVRSPGRENEDYDVIVIGSGMGGGTLADSLSDQGIKVLILEAGGMQMPIHMNELPRTEVNLVGRDEIGHFSRDAGEFSLGGVHFNLGGRSIYWSGLIPRMESWEFRQIWPQSVKEYLLEKTNGLTGYERAEKLMRKQRTLGRYQQRVLKHFGDELGCKYRVEDLPRSMHQPDIDDDGCIQNVIQRSTGGFSTADLLLDSLGFSKAVGKRNLCVNLHHLVKRIEITDSRATGVVCEDLLNHTERRYRGRFVVLACGSVESPRLAMASNLHDPNGKIGKGFTDHPAYFYKKLHALPSTGSLAWLGDSRGHAKVMLRHRNASASSHPYNIELLIGAKFWDARHADDDLWENHIGGDYPAEVEIKFIFDSMLNDANYIGYVGEGEKVRVSVNWNGSGSTLKNEMVEVRNEILSSLGVTGLSDHYVNEEWSEGVYGSVHHAGGSLRMSADGTGVVDENLKFYNYENLFCCDVSVFPTIPAANPSLTLVAIAQRLADHLAAM